MALGGGTFLTQNKILPGSYINFVSVDRASATLSDRGIAALPLPLGWGPEGEVFAVTNDTFQRDSLKIFGYPYTADELKGLRDFFQSAKTGYFYRLNADGVKASNTYATAKYPGIRGNSLRIVIEENEASEPEGKLYNVYTYLDSTLVGEQRAVSAASDLTGNDYVDFKSEASLAATAGTPLTGGTDGTVEDAAWQAALDKLESYSFNTLGCLSTDDTVKGLYAAFTKRMRDDCGVKFQCVLFRYTKADYEGVISVENGLTGADDDPSMVYWVTGAEAGCAVNATLTNTAYTGEFVPKVDYTQAQLQEGILSGKLMLHRVGEDIRVLSDVNTFTSVTVEKNADFSDNQVMRVLDQIGNDIAVLFNTKYLGKVPNDNAGRISLWKDICKHHTELQNIRAIQDFDSDNVTVTQGDSKKAVVVTDYVTPVCAMTQLYMTVKVN